MSTFSLSIFSLPFPVFSLSSIKSVSSNKQKSFRLGTTANKQSKHATFSENIHEKLDPTFKKGDNVKVVNGLDVLYEDGHGSVSVKDYFAAAKEIVKDDGGPPRWFCPVECRQPIKDAAVMFFLPGIDGTGMGLIMHHKSLGKVFEVRCLHIPVKDQTPFEGLVKFVENSVKQEHATSPNKPIYILGDSFGGCLALSVAARNPSVDLVVILVNPATAFGKSQLQPFLPIVEALQGDLYATLPYALSSIMGNPIKMAMTSVGKDLPPSQTLQELLESLTSLLPLLSDLSDILPKNTLTWKLKLLKSSSAYTNSRLHSVEAQVLLIVSGNDGMLPSGEEADRLYSKLKNCKVRYFKDSGHTILLEDDFNLLTVIKRTTTYRLSSKHDFVTDFLPPTRSEYLKHCVRDTRLYHLATCPVMLSTLNNGRIVKGLAGVPDDGPVLLVGYHMLVGLELEPLYEAFLREKNIIIRGMAHPSLFTADESSRTELSRFDLLPAFGALPVSPTNLYRLLSKNSYVLLYPGGAREALHRKGEEYQLFWPEQPEFVRMAARFGATIVPFGVVGEDDIVELILDYDDLSSIPYIRESIQNMNDEGTKLRTDMDGEIANQDLYIPGLLPKIPGRFYYLFGKPLETRGKKNILKDKEMANEIYLDIKSEIEAIILYLKTKREEDPYRSIVQRAIYQGSWGSDSDSEVPSFDL